MKKLLVAFCLVLGSQFVIADEPVKHETKRVCVDQMKDGKPVTDAKTGKTKQTCRDVKQHRKLEVQK